MKVFREIERTALISCSLRYSCLENPYFVDALPPDEISSRFEDDDGMFMVRSISIRGRGGSNTGMLLSAEAVYRAEFF